MSPLFARGFARSPITALDAELAGWHPVDLAVVVVRESLLRARLAAGLVDEIVVGCAEPVGAQGADAARAIALGAGWPGRIGGFVVDRAETSGMTAVQVAADGIRAGRCSRVMVVGLSMASTVPPGASALNRTYGAPWGAGVAERADDDGGLVPAPLLSEAAASSIGLDRADLDAFAERSLALRRRAPSPPAVVAVAARPGESAPLARRGDTVPADTFREWGSAAQLPPAFDTAGLTTAATVAPPADSVAAMVLEATPEGPPSGLELIGIGRAAGELGDPTGSAVTAVERALSEAVVDLRAVDLLEVVETSAASAVIIGRSLGPDLARDLNRHGGALATGDAGAAEELRLVTDAADRLEPGRILLAVSAGPTGSAATLWRRPAAPVP